MIRAATLDDIPALAEMGQRFANRARLTDHVGYDPASMAVTFAALIENDANALFIGESGAIGGVTAPHPFNHAHYVAHEMFWWSEGREGLQLLDAFEVWARERCHSIGMITLEAVNADRMERFYIRSGFVPLERSFIKVF